MTDNCEAEIWASSEIVNLSVHMGGKYVNNSKIKLQANNI